MRVGRWWTLLPVLLVGAIGIPAMSAAAPLQASVNWPRYQFTPANRGYNPFETSVTASNVQFLSLKYIAVMNPFQESLIDKSAPAVVGDV
ncbi:MAG TPA: hypothetical protein VF972_01990, partial [Actinomycetota bacterium]